jgi:aldehyde dehydrogenase (NAD+)
LELIKTSGGNILLGGTGNVQERWIDPTLIESPKLDSKLMQEEIFGPVLPVVSYKDDNEVINFINARNKPLALYYFGSRNDFKNVTFCY